MIEVGLVNLGSNNLFSINNALKHLDLKVTTLNHYNDYVIFKPDILILPGVGSFPSAMKKIFKEKFDQIIYDHHSKNKPILGICLGAQLLLRSSDEFTKTSGLNLINGDVKSLKDLKVKTPNINWSRLSSRSNKYKNIFDKKYFYHIHSYYINISSNENIIATISIEDNEICVAYKKNNIVGLQFHPEKSGKNGVNLLYTIIHEIFKI